MTRNLTIIKFWKPLAVIFIWGVSFIATKYTLGELNPLVIILLRQIIGVMVLVLFAAWILLNEHVTFLTMVSGIIIVGGVMLVNKN